MFVCLGFHCGFFLSEFYNSNKKFCTFRIQVVTLVLVLDLFLDL